MSSSYDKLAAIIRNQHDPVVHDPDTPYRGIAYLWGGDHFPSGRDGPTEREDWYALPGSPDVLLCAGHVPIKGRNVPFDSGPNSRPEDVALLEAYFSNPEVYEAYQLVRDVLKKRPNY